MGCNFYTMSGKHIGKRSAAGLYCWDCEITLCKGGKDNVHHSGYEWYDKCPACGKEYIGEGLEASSAGRELGFNKGEYKIKSGVASCSSFNWAMHKDKLKRIRFVKDEYGKKYTTGEFWDMFKEIPIEFTDMIGSEFS
jgi:hypothetical protein